ncbi:hypothetical protein [Nocardia sp. NPDC052316]|uniref:hypothetical protein n=1 Tax=Nocardia sp. NPDC052316 TaxID=3364329 RepID=UPI0037CC4A5E
MVLLSRFLQRKRRPTARLRRPWRTRQARQGCAADWKRVWGDYREHRNIWVANNPYSQAAELTGIPLFVSYGKGDAVESLAYEQNYRFVDRLQELGA